MEKPNNPSQKSPPNGLKWLQPFALVAIILFVVALLLTTNNMGNKTRQNVEKQDAVAEVPSSTENPSASSVFKVEPVTLPLKPNQNLPLFAQMNLSPFDQIFHESDLKEQPQELIDFIKPLPIEPPMQRVQYLNSEQNHPLPTLLDLMNPAQQTPVFVPSDFLNPADEFLPSLFDFLGPLQPPMLPQFSFRPPIFFDPISFARTPLAPFVNLEPVRAPVDVGFPLPEGPTRIMEPLLFSNTDIPSIPKQKEVINDDTLSDTVEKLFRELYHDSAEPERAHPQQQINIIKTPEVNPTEEAVLNLPARLGLTETEQQKNLRDEPHAVEFRNLFPTETFATQKRLNLENVNQQDFAVPSF